MMGPKELPICDQIGLGDLHKEAIFRVCAQYQPTEQQFPKFAVEAGFEDAENHIATLRPSLAD